MSVSVATVALDGGTAYPVISLDIDQDNDRVPEWSGNFVVPFTAGGGLLDYTSIDPQATPYHTARLTWTYDAGTILDTLLLVRRARVSDIARTVTFTVASGEVLLQDNKNVTKPSGDYSPGVLTQKAMWQFALARLTASGIVSNVDTLTSAAVSIPATATVWKNGQDLDSWLRGALRPSNLEVYQDTAASLTSGLIALRTASMANATKANRGGTVTIAYGQNMTLSDWETSVDPTDGVEWGEAMVADYNWTTSAGVVNRKSYADYSVPNYRKALHLSFDTGDSGVSPVSSLLSQALVGGRSANLEMTPTAAYSATGAPLTLGPGHTVLIYRPEFVFPRNWKGVMNRIHWTFPADRVEVGVKNLAINGPQT